MNAWIPVAIVATALVLAPTAARSQSTHFSSTFKASVDKAMAQPTSEGRTKLLIEALRQGTDDEVFVIFPLLFPAKILNGAMDAHVCLPEIKASLSIERVYLKSSATEQTIFPTVHAESIRGATNNLVTCLDKYYANGSLRFPHASSN